MKSCTNKNTIFFIIFYDELELRTYLLQENWRKNTCHTNFRLPSILQRHRTMDAVQERIQPQSPQDDNFKGNNS
jgi:hypothetical protein